MASCIRLQIEKKKFESSAGLDKNCLLMNEFDDEEIAISQYSSQTNGALAEWIYKHPDSYREDRGSIP